MALFGRSTPPVSRLEELKRVLIKDPTSRQFLALADEYRKAGKSREAMETLERGLSIHTNYVAAHVALGRVNLDLGRADHALDNFLNALKFDRENLVALRMAGEIYLQKGEKIEAIKKLKVFRALNPGDREVNQIVQNLDIELAAARKAAGLPDIPRSTASYMISSARAERMTSGLRPAVPSPVVPSPPPPMPSGTRPAVGPGVPQISQPFFIAGILGGTAQPVPPSAPAPPVSSLPPFIPQSPAAPPFVPSPTPPAVQARSAVPVPPPPSAPVRAEAFEMTFDGERRTPLAIPKPQPPVESKAPWPPPPVAHVVPVILERVPDVPFTPTPPPPDEGRTTIIPIVQIVAPAPSALLSAMSPAETIAIRTVFEPRVVPVLERPPVPPSWLPSEPVVKAAVAETSEPAWPPEPEATPASSSSRAEVFESVFESLPPLPLPPPVSVSVEPHVVPEPAPGPILPPPSLVERSGSFDETPFGAAFAAGATSHAKDVETPVDDVFGPAEPAPTEQVAVSETLAELYRSQGYVDEAKATYEALARVTPQPEKARELIEKAAHLPVSELAAERGVATPVPVDEKPPQETPVLPVESALAGRLAEWATGITVRSTGEPPEFDLGLVLEQLTRPGTSVTSAFLTTTEGLPLASAGDVEGPESESFIGDLTAFWKSAESRSGELETGGPQTLFLEGSKGLGVVCQAGLGQLLLLMARPKAIKGQVRFESRRAAATIERGLS